MHDFLRLLSRRALPEWIGYASVVVLIGVATVARLLVPLDTAPFLLYMPAVFVIATAFGRGPGVAAVAASTAFASYLFLRASDEAHLGAGQVVALIQYVVISAGMILVCDALRRVLQDNEGYVDALSATNASLAAAKADADAARESAEAANRAKSSFLANMSHELRTPLSAVIGYSEMMEEDLEDQGQGEALADLGKIKSNARHLLSLINDVLDLSKIEAGRMDTYAEDVDVAALAAEVESTVGSLVARKNNRLVLDLGPGLGAMRTDVVKLRQCLFNLLSNAAKFTEDGLITLGVRRDGDTLVFSVADTGIGMTAEQLGRLFERFAQADEATTRKFGGTGLGLALTRAFARLLGGDVAVASRPDDGTTFTLRLPAAMPEGGVEPAEATQSAVPSTAEGRGGEPERQTVLVIDDDPAQRELMTRFLERQGYAVRAAPGGAAGIALAREIRPRAITLDVMMPEMDGWSVLGALKADPAVAAIPVVMVSFVNDAGLEAALGAVDHVDKPVAWDRLKAVMDHLRVADGEVLVVDDDSDMRERLRHTLTRQGWSVVEAENGRVALDLVRHGPPRAVLLDLSMPVMDGFAFLHALRAVPGCADLPVIVFSARDLSREERARLGEADVVMSKTADLKAVAGELHALVPPHPHDHPTAEPSP